MTEPLFFTGERFMPECEGEIWYEHWHRYALVRQLCQHRTVLDVACGEGYGAAMMAENALRVTGVDISTDAIRHARSSYGHRANLEFIAASCDSLPFPDASFDLAVSFETIEHIETQQAFIAELARVLRPDGVLLLSSPNKRLYSDAHDYRNEFHVRELYRSELEELLSAAFPHRSWLGQKLLFHSAIWPENRDVAATEYLVEDGGQVVAGRSPSVEPMYYIVACSRNPSALPGALNKLSLFSDAAETVYRDYARQTRRVIELDRLLIDRERLVAERDDLLALRTGQMEERDALLMARTGQIAERDDLLALRTVQMEERDRIIAERDTLLALRTGQMEERDRIIAERDAFLARCAGQIEERERIIAERDALLALRTGQMEERERMIAERDALLALRGGQIEEREQIIAERDTLLGLRTGQMEERDRMIAERDRIIVERDALLALRTGQMEERDRMIAERDALLAQRAEQIAERDAFLAQRAERIAALNMELDYRAGLGWWVKSPWRLVKQIFKGNA